MIHHLSKYKLNLHKLMQMKHKCAACQRRNKLQIISYYCCKSNARQNTRLIDRMTEVKYFQHSKDRTKKKINYLRIQRFKGRLIHWFHFDPVRDLSHLLTVKTFLLHSAVEFLCERKSSIFWRRQKSCSIHHRQIRLRTPKERVVFSDC